MKFQSRETYQVPADEAYARLSDFDALTEVFQSYGAQVLEHKTGWPDGSDTKWRLAAGIKGIRREIKAEVTRVVPQRGFTVVAQAEGIVAELDVSVVPEGEVACAVVYDIALSSRGMAARLLLQSLRFAQANVEQKVNSRLTAFTKGRLDLA